MDYTDAKMQGLTLPSHEESILIIRPNNYTKEDFLAFAELLRSEFNQDSVVIKIDNTISLLFKGGDTYDIGNKFTMGKLGQGYSSMRNKPNIPFVFEFAD